MAFKLNRHPRFTVTIKPEVEGAEPIGTFTATFLAQPASAMQDMTTDEGQIAFLKRAVVGLGGIEDDDGKELPFDDSLLDMVIDRMDCRTALLTAYAQAFAAGARGN